MIDLDYLHDYYLGRRQTGHRRDGTTFAMLVEAVQHADLGERTVIVVANCDPSREDMIRTSSRIADHLRFFRNRIDRNTLRVDKMVMKFVTPSFMPHELKGLRCPIFVDHHVRSCSK